MKAIRLVPGTTDVALENIEEPVLSKAEQIKVRVREVGICGTDREEAQGGRAAAPPGKSSLVLGHEMFGEVVEVGEKVKDVQPGDFGVFTVRRGCNKCVACLHNRSDMCYTGDYTERGIKGADGFQAEYVIDDRTHFIKVPPAVKEIGVLTEPMSVAAKAIGEAMIVQQSRLKDFDRKDNWLEGKKALIAGIGPIGLMAAFALRLHGSEVIAMDIVDQAELRVSILKEIGGTYVDGRKTDVTMIDEVCGGCDFVFEATGIAKLQIQLIDTLAINGVYVATGIPGGNRPMTIMAGDIMQQLVLKNQILIGSVNASPAHYEAAVRYLERCKQQWPGIIEKVITNRVRPEEFDRVLKQPTNGEIKAVVDWYSGQTLNS